jgi:hypothetical protein
MLREKMKKEEKKNRQLKYNKQNTLSNMVAEHRSSYDRTWFSGHCKQEMFILILNLNMVACFFIFFFFAAFFFVLKS